VPWRGRWLRDAHGSPAERPVTLLGLTRAPSFVVLQLCVSLIADLIADRTPFLALRDMNAGDKR
jgi:hypothetical protein